MKRSKIEVIPRVCNRLYAWLTSVVLVGLCASFIQVTQAAETKFAEGVNYITVSPSVVVNFGGSTRPRYIKAEISLRAESAQAAAKLTHHLPLVRDRLVAVFSQQTEEVLTSAEGREALRVGALNIINQAIVAAEYGKGAQSVADDEMLKNYASDLYFTNFVVQR